MINTELHNALIEKQMQKSVIAAERLSMREQRALKREKVFSYLPLVGFVFLILLLLILLYWLFPVKDFSSLFQSSPSREKQVECPTEEKLLIGPKQDKELRPKESVPLKRVPVSRQPKNDSSLKSEEGVLKEGIEYVKHDHHVYKRTWEAGRLVSDERLEETIEDSRAKSNEKIPQLATPKKGHVE